LFQKAFRWGMGVILQTPQAQRNKSFLLLFFKKEVLLLVLR
jgi:hypothetical protein